MPGGLAAYLGGREQRVVTSPCGEKRVGVIDAPLRTQTLDNAAAGAWREAGNPGCHLTAASNHLIVGNHLGSKPQLQ